VRPFRHRNATNAISNGINGIYGHGYYGNGYGNGYGYGNGHVTVEISHEEQQSSMGTMWRKSS